MGDNVPDEKRRPEYAFLLGIRALHCCKKVVLVFFGLFPQLVEPEKFSAFYMIQIRFTHAAAPDVLSLNSNKKIEKKEIYRVR